MPIVHHALVGAAALAALSAASLHAADKGAPTETPRIFQEVIDCKIIEADDARLACYDQKVEALRIARDDKQILVADKEQVKKDRKSLFGLAIPDLGIFGDDDENEGREIESVIKSVRATKAGYVFTLEDGAVWIQAESRELGRIPKAGLNIVIKRAAMGSFMGKIEGGRTFRIKRTNP